MPLLVKKNIIVIFKELNYFTIFQNKFQFKAIVSSLIKLQLYHILECWLKFFFRNRLVLQEIMKNYRKLKKSVS